MATGNAFEEHTSPQQHQEQETAHSTSEWLTLSREKLKEHVGQSATHDDLEILMFSLFHLFQQNTLLFQHALPTLTEYLLSRTEPPHMPNHELHHRHHIWTQLHSVKYSVERIEILGHLLNDATASLIRGLDGHEDTLPMTVQRENATHDGLDTETTVTTEQWDAAFTPIAEQLDCWQRYQMNAQPFVQHFAALLPLIPALGELDKALNRLLENIIAIFGDILPDVHALGRGDDEALATLLLDLTQQADEILTTIGVLLDPLAQLIKHQSIQVEVP